MVDEWIPEETWRTIVRRVPIVSVDLLVSQDGGLLLGKRSNEPAKGDWFVPGGRVRKYESRSKAAHRIAEEELGLKVEIVEEVGTYEHIYENSEFDESIGKHYLATGYVVNISGGDIQSDSQHESFRVFQTPPDPLHKYVHKYLVDAETLSDWP